MNKSFWSIIGKRRSKGFFFVLSINAGLVAALMLWFMPQKDTAIADLANTEQQKLGLQNQIVELPKKYEVMQQNEQAYDILQQRGFFMQQDRIAFRQLLNDLRLTSGVRLVSYDIKPQEVIVNQALTNSDKQLLSSDVNVNLRGLTDLEMRAFVHALQAAIPGLNTVTKQSYKRASPLNDENLIKLGNGQPIDFVEGNYSFKWFTLYDKPDPLGMQAQPGTPGGAPTAPAAAAPVSARPSAPEAGDQ